MVERTITPTDKACPKCGGRMDVHQIVRTPFPEEPDLISDEAVCSACGNTIVLFDPWTGYQYLFGGTRPRDDRAEFDKLLSVMVNSKVLSDGPPLVLQAIVLPVDEATEGDLIKAVSLPWLEIVERITRSPDEMYHIDWRKWEEIIAAAYDLQGFEVILTPRSGDKGRDVIATSKRLGTVRFFEQVKAYGPGHLVSADDVRSMVGVLTIESNVSKGLVTTTSQFASGIRKDRDIARLIPYRLELKDRDGLLAWLASVAAGMKRP